MARFVYKMQSGLNIKQQTENQTKMEFAMAQAELNKQIDILEEYVTRKILDILGDGDQADEILKRRDAEDMARISIPEEPADDNEPEPIPQEQEV